MKAEIPFPRSTRDVCEALLKQQRETRPFPGEIEVIDRLLARGLELSPAYQELHVKLHGCHRALGKFFDLLLSTAASSHPDGNSKVRQGKVELAEVNKEIAQHAAALARLLTKRTELKNYSDFTCQTFYHPVDVINAAGEGHYRYQRQVKDKLKNLTREFDLKYWPSLESVIRAIAEDAEKAIPEPKDAVVAAVTETRRGSLADSFKALIVSLKEGEIPYGYLPAGFNLTDQSMAILLSCALSLHESVDSTYVKRLRQRGRHRQSQE